MVQRSTRKRHETKRLDALLALPLDRFRRAAARLSGDELAALEARLGVQRMKHRWARGGSGVERHRSPQELALLARRDAALRNEREARMTALPEPIRLATRGASVSEAVADVSEQQAA